MSPILIIFSILAAITIATALLAVFSKNPINSAIFLVICFASVAGHYLLLNAQFLAIAHLIVYLGAIMILFVFSIMLMNLGEVEHQKISKKKAFYALTVFALIIFVLLAIFINPGSIREHIPTEQDYQSIKVLGKILLNEYMVPFEFVSVLLLVAMIGAVLLSKKEKREN